MSVMTEKEYVYLCGRYLSGHITPAEQERLLQYQQDHLLEELPWDTAEMGPQAEIKHRLYHRLLLSIHPKRRRMIIYRSIAAAAVILFSLAFYLFNQGNAVYRPPVGAKKAATDILPGTQKAILTLSNGKRVMLDGEKKGWVARQGNVTVAKNGGGQLIYQQGAGDGLATRSELMNTVSTPRGGRYSVVLPDGTKVWLNAASALTFPANFSGSVRRVSLSGEAYFEVAKDRSKPFRVACNTQEIEVLGTHFNISAYPDEDIARATLTAGSVKITQNGQTGYLRPGQCATTSKQQKGISIGPADIARETGWMNGYFVFREESIQDIMRMAARWYDVEVRYQGDFSGKSYGGRVSQYRNISELLKNLELTGTIHFKIEGRRVTVLE